MKKRDPWIWRPKAWEFEIFIFLLFILSFSLPILLDDGQVLESPFTNSDAPHIYDVYLKSWSWLLLLVYAAHFFMGRLAPVYVVPSFTHLISPSLVAAAGCLNVYSTFVFSLSEVLMVMIAVLGMTYLLAKFHKWRVLKLFKDEPWEVNTPPRKDLSYIGELLLLVRPLFYNPKAYRASENGIMIEGGIFVAAIPFGDIEAIANHVEGQIASTGCYFSRSMHQLMMMSLKKNQETIFISPQDDEDFFSYCREAIH